ncbi:MAG TPA: methyltransferase domain-containing protein [Vicinamibacterales bacterium]|nr:methyltransferase domain-containing protein [Vicinamibacterales bacterium]
MNLGCGSRPLAGYINVDVDSIDEIRARYPGRDIPTEAGIERYDIFNLPFAAGSVDEVRAESLIEHLAFADERRFFTEMARILRPGGLAYLTTVDFELAVRQWLAAPDDWRDFYRSDDEAIRAEHWFGTYTYAPVNRWGYLTATLFGNQRGAGQFHRNCYSEAKLRAICERMAFDVESIERFQWQGNRDHMLAVSARKRC